MDDSDRDCRALGLFGGGLDSLLAFEAMKRAGFKVEGIHLETGFVREPHRERARKCGRVEIVDVRQRYLEEVVAAPRFGYGSGMNPCHDCRAFMLARARDHAQRRGIARLFTGDVVGQRGHDQSHHAFAVADREGGVEGRVARPLSAAHLDPPSAGPELPPDAAEHRLQGRSRRGQLALAEAWGITGYPTPSGRCCHLADPAFARRMRDYLEHRDRSSLQARDIPILHLGRHFRLGWNLKLIVSRSASEARRLNELGAGPGRCAPADRPGPEGYIEAAATDPGADHDIAAVLARYTLGEGGGTLRVRIEAGGEMRVVEAAPASASSIEAWRI